MKVYQTRHNYSLNLNTNLKDYKRLSRVETIIVNLNESYTINNEYFSKKEEFKSANFKIESSGRIDAILYWYELVDESNNCQNWNRFYSPFSSNLDENNLNASDQLASVCLFRNSINENLIDEDKRQHNLKINYLFKNDIFHVKNFQFD